MKLTYTLPILLLISTCTQATMFAGDILGRDLTLKYPIGGVAQVGHVGVWNGQQVVEVLNEFPAIKFNIFKFSSGTLIYEFHFSSSFALENGRFVHTNPAAPLWPPPPCFLAISETSTT